MNKQNNNLRMFFNACVLWCEDQLILCPTLHLPSLSPGYLPERLSLLMDKSEVKIASLLVKDDCKTVFLLKILKTKF